MRFIESDEKLCLRGAALEEAIQDDIKLGLIPFWVSSYFYDTAIDIVCVVRFFVVAKIHLYTSLGSLSKSA